METEEMPKYRPVYTKIWKDRDFLKAGKDAKLLFLYFITNESITNSGIYEIPIKTISVETGIPCSTVEQLLGNRSIKNIEYDLENEIVFVANARKYCSGGNPAQVEKGIISEFKQNSKTFLWNLFLELNPQFKEIFSTVGQPLVNRSLPLPLPLPLKDLNNNSTNSKFEKWFEEDWKNYPKKGVKQKAKQKYLSTVTSEEKRLEFQEKTKKYLESVSDPTYYKNGDTWFNQWQTYEINEIKANPSKKKTTVRHNLDLIKNIDLGGEDDNKRIQSGNGHNVGIGTASQP